MDIVAHDMPWTQELGDAVLAERPAVMDAVQRMRHQAWTYGYLHSNGSYVYFSVNDSRTCTVIGAGCPPRVPGFQVHRLSAATAS